VTRLPSDGVAAPQTSRSWAGWRPPSGIALIAAAPVLPHIPLALGLSIDDLLPLLGLGLLVWRQPLPRLTSDRLLRFILAAIAVALLARTATAMVNGGGLEGTLKMLAQAIARPVVLVGIAAYVAVTAPPPVRQRLAAVSVAAVGTFVAAFGLVGFLVRLPNDFGIEATRKLTSLYGVCPGRITGTLGLSSNHVGAIFVLSLPISLGVAVSSTGWRRWAWAAASALQAAALVMTFTRSSILLGTVLGIGFLLYQRKLVMLAIVAAIATGIVAAAFSVSCTTAAAPLLGRLSDSNDRLALWYSASRIMLDHPLVGVGLDRMDDVVKADPDRYRTTPFGPATSTAHNTILLAGAETGIPGGLAILAVNVGLAGVALRTAWRGRRRDAALLLASSLAVAGFLAQGMFNNLFSVPAATVVFALVIGAIAVGSASPGGPYTSRRSDEHELDGEP
jgi:O-antigen ligase